MGLYTFLYSIYFYLFCSEMDGLLQFVYFFGTSLHVCIAMSLFCGSLAWLGAYRFVSLIYSNIKAE